MLDLRISAKDIGAVNMQDFCPRCFWIKRNAKALPFQIFPGIFASIDSYTKKIMHHLHDADKKPAWMEDAVRYMKVPHHTKFFRRDPETGIALSGGPDDIFETHGGQHIIPDYKTAKFTENQDKLRPMYEAQLNGYAWIDEGFGALIHSLPLVYCEPMTEEKDACKDDHGKEQFALGFSIHAVQILHDPELIPRLLKKAAEVMELEIPPDGVDGCKDCQKLAELVSVAA